MRVWGSAKLCGINIPEERIARRQYGGVSASALTRELVRRAGLCKRLAGKQADLIGQLSATTPVCDDLEPLCAHIVHYDDGSVGDGPGRTLVADEQYDPADFVEPWDRRIYLAWLTEQKLRESVRCGSEAQFAAVAKEVGAFIAIHGGGQQ